ncbi:CocE/NonD family hydrolase [Pseudonocardia ailaonensis]|uniref:CocE/NonD family hydrolase n=1 Tax=Pseudonocardia ailaonensis TaxID=367279 RepID=A0ABN2NEJ8_9PSEU
MSALLRERNLPVTLPDGVVLRADVYRDPAAGPQPVLLQYTAYDKSNWTSVNGVVNPERAVDAGFVVVVVDARGRFRSEGEFRPFVDTGPDAAACIAWAAEQPWSTGRVGMYGASNNGVPQWQALREKAPALGAIVPHFTASEFDQGWVYRGGAFTLGFNLWWSVANLAPDQVARVGADPAPLAAALRDPGFDRLPLEDVPALAHSPHYAEWVANPPGSDYWRDLSARDALTTTEVPILNVAGWYNVHLDGNLANFEAVASSGGPAARSQRLVIGPWIQWMPTFLGDSCGPERRFPGSLSIDLEGMQLAWFAHHLGDGPDPAFPPVRLYVMGADVWRDEQEWPPARARTVPYYLHADGTLTPEEPGEEPASSWVHDPHDPVPTRGGSTYLPTAPANIGPMDRADLHTRPDVLLFRGPVLTEPVEVTGPVRAVVHLQTDAPATDVTVTLVDIHPDGRATLLCDGIRRVTAEQVAAAGDEPVRVEIDLVATSNLFREGHAIGVEIASSSFPKWDRHAGTQDGRARSSADLRVAHQTLLHSSEFPAAVLLPMVPVPGAGEVSA